MRIDIWSDIVCPWCYVGKSRFEKALAQFGGRETVAIVHRSFQLNPAAPRDRTSSRREMLMQKYRLSPQQVVQMDERMTQTAAAEGLDFNLDGAQTGNTFDAHQLVHFAHAHGLQDEMVERLFRAYFTEQRSVFDRAELAALAADVGLEREAAAAAMRENRYADAVNADIDLARRIGATGVPLFVFDGRYGISGAQAPEVLLDALHKAMNHHESVG